MSESRIDSVFAKETIDRIRENVKQVIVGKDEVIDKVLVCLISGGHVLLEDVPGLGKTTLVSALSKSINCSFKRIQFTPDVLPSDIGGYTMFNMKTGEKEFHEGAIMSQFVLADEINRTSPKTQSALLEAMSEGQVTVDGYTYDLPQPFIVLATQNPVELSGTYPLPEAQLDRFMMKLSIGYPSQHEEVRILSGRRSENPLDTLQPVATADDIIALRQMHSEVLCSDPVNEYIVNLSIKTRNHESVALGISPRGSLSLMNASMAYALLNGRDYVIPDDVQAMAESVLTHRIQLQNRAKLRNITPVSVIREIVRSTSVPQIQ